MNSFNSIIFILLIFLTSCSHRIGHLWTLSNINAEIRGISSEWNDVIYMFTPVCVTDNRVAESSLSFNNTIKCGQRHTKLVYVETNYFNDFISENPNFEDRKYFYHEYKENGKIIIYNLQPIMKHSDQTFESTLRRNTH